MFLFRRSRLEVDDKDNQMRAIWGDRCGKLLHGMRDTGNCLRLQPQFKGRFATTLRHRNGLVDGHQRYEDMIKMMDLMVSATKKTWKLSETQRLYHKVFMNALIPHIYGVDTFEQHQRTILAHHNITCIDIAVLVRASRRAGKTMAIAVMIAAFLLCVPGHNGLIISQHQAASSALMSQVRAIQSEDHEGGSRVFTYWLWAKVRYCQTDVNVSHHVGCGFFAVDGQQ
jgi:hypothetical protein